MNVLQVCNFCQFEWCVQELKIFSVCLKRIQKKSKKFACLYLVNSLSNFLQIFSRWAPTQPLHYHLDKRSQSYCMSVWKSWLCCSCSSCSHSLHAPRFFVLYNTLPCILNSIFKDFNVFQIIAFGCHTNVLDQIMCLACE